MGDELLGLCKEYLQYIKMIGSGLYHLDDMREKCHNEISRIIYDNVHPDNRDAAICTVEIYLHDLPDDITAVVINDYINDIIWKYETNGKYNFRKA